MKESKNKHKLQRHRSNHKCAIDSPHKLKDRSVLSNDNKKMKIKHKPPINTKPGCKSVPKIKMKIEKNITNSEESGDEGIGFDEYFIFENRIFPVINSDEKRVVNSYFWTNDTCGK